MKKQPEPKKTEATVTSMARLTIRGQIFEMPLEELEDLYAKIGAALGKKSPNLADEYRKLIERTPRWEPPVVPHYIQPRPIDPPSRKTGLPPEVWCTAVSIDGPQLGKHTDQRERFP